MCVIRRWPKRRYAAHTCIVNCNTGSVFCTSVNIPDTWVRFYVSKSVEQSPSWEANSFSANQEYGTPRFITTFAGALHLSLYCARSVHTSNPTFGRLIVILSSHLRLVLPSGLFPSCFPAKTLYPLILSSHLSLGLPSGLFPSGLSTKILNATHLSPIRPKCFAPIFFFIWWPEWYLAMPTYLQHTVFWHPPAMFLLQSERFYVS